jgi:tetratricopeptide (TPR) repeat protein
LNAARYAHGLDCALRRLGRAEDAEQAGRLSRDLLGGLLGSPAGEEAAAELADQLWEGAREPWVGLSGVKVSAKSTILTPLLDGSIRASGPNPENDTYTVVGQTDLVGITELRLEVLPDPTLPAGGPGRYGNGNFHLTQLSVEAGPASVPNRSSPVPLNQARASFSSRESLDHGGAAAVIDGKDDTSWDVWDRVGRAHTAWFSTAKPVGGPGPTRLTVRLHFDHPGHKFHALGRFRLSVTSPSRQRAWMWWQWAGGESASAWTQLGAVQAFRGEWAAARATLETATARPGGGTVRDHLLLCLVLDRLGQHARAGVAWEGTLARLPGGYGDDPVLAGLVRQALDQRPPAHLTAELLAVRAELLAAEEKWAEVLADLKRIRELAATAWPGLVSRRLLGRLVEESAAIEDWAVVRLALARLRQSAPNEPRAWLQSTIVLAHLGNVKEHTLVRAEMWRRFGGTADQILAERVVRSSGLLAGGEEQKEQRAVAYRLLQANPSDAWRLLALGMAEYRAGRWNEADRVLRHSFALGAPDGTKPAAGLLLAMTLQRRGRPDQAQALLRHLREEILPGLLPLRGNRDHWHDWLAVQILNREAQALIGEPQS